MLVAEFLIPLLRLGSTFRCQFCLTYQGYAAAPGARAQGRGCCQDAYVSKHACPTPVNRSGSSPDPEEVGAACSLCPQCSPDARMMHMPYDVHHSGVKQNGNTSSGAQARWERGDPHADWWELQR